jgi:hypothetical protein
MMYYLITGVAVILALSVAYCTALWVNKDGDD